MSTGRRFDAANEIAESSSNLLGSLAGVIVGAIAGPEGAIAGAVTGAVVAPIIQETGKRVLARALGFWERKRVDAAVEQAGRAIRRNLDAGGAIRTDADFWASCGGFAPAVQEVFEATLNAVRNDPEERKAPFMGTLFAYIACDEHLSRSAAHWAVKTAESLTWSQFQLLALVARASEFDLAAIEIGKSGPTWDSFGLHQELSNLGVGGRYLIHGGTEPTWNGIDVPTRKLDRFLLRNEGPLLYSALGLESIPIPELAGVLRRLQGPTAG